MADEARITSTLNITKRSGTIYLLNYRSTESFQADVDGTKGPSPGSITVLETGTAVDFSQLTRPGWCRIKNQDDENYVEWGSRDTDNNRFFPLGELLPGESVVIRLSRNLLEGYEGTGTGTTGPTQQLWMKAGAGGGSVNVLVEAFDTV